MTKFWLVLLSLAMALAMVFGLAACEPSDPDKDKDEDKDPGGTTENEITEVVGDYSVDLSEAGMPMVVYFQIKEDGSFLFSGKEDFSQEKSAGTVSKLSEGYVLLFSRVNGETVAAGKTCNITKDADGGLSFDGTIPYGTANFASPMENDDGATIVIRAVPLSEGGGTVNEYTVEAGTYYGTHSTSGGMSTTYEYYLTLREDGKFTAFVTYSAMGQTMMGYDYGTYAVMGSACRMTSSVYDDKESGEDLLESLTVDTEGVYTADVRMSRMASDTVEVTLEKLTESPKTVVASYEGTHTISMGMPIEFALSLEIYADGRYLFSAASSMGEPSTEEGFIGIENAMSNAGILLPDGMSSPADITLNDEGALTGLFSMGAGSRQEVTLTPVAA